MDWLSILSLRMNHLWQEQPIHGLKNCIASTDVATLKKQLTVLTAAGVIKESKDMKPEPQEAKQPVSKQVRFCLDYQHFTQRTLPDLYSDQNIERGLNCLAGNEYFTVLGLVSGICQLPTFPGEREKPYSVRPLGFYEYERMQPGYCENLAGYQRLLEDVLKDMNMVELLVYMDYVIVFGTTFSEYTWRLHRTLQRLQDEGFKFSREQSIFCRPIISYAGHEVCEEGISIEDSKKEVLTKWPKPRTVSELQCYVDFCRYYRQFVSGFQDLAMPLNRLLQDAADHKAKNPAGPWWATESIEERWTKECDEAFCQLKDRLMKSTFVTRANMSQPEAPNAVKK